MGIERIRPDAPNSEITYQYNIKDNKIIGYTETENGNLIDYSVSWVE